MIILSKSLNDFCQNLRILVILLHTVIANSFNIPGLAPTNFCKKSDVSSPCMSHVILYVNRLNSEKSVIPYDYHHFDFCLGKEEISPVENLGQVVFGERIQPGPYNIQFLEDVECAKACVKTYTSGQDDSDRRLMLLKKGISLNYQHHWIVDNMPVIWCQPEKEIQNCSISFPMGYKQSSNYYPFNHVDLEITYQDGASEVGSMGSSGRIISVKVNPKSINHPNPDKPNCLSTDPLAIKESSLKSGEVLNIVYTYGVKFIQNNSEKWSSRWDYTPESNHLSTYNKWLKILNSYLSVFSS